MTPHNFQLAVCAEMVFTELPFLERVTRIRDLGFDVEIWDWTNKDLEALRANPHRHRCDVVAGSTHA